MKRIAIVAVTLGMVASATFAKELTVTHKSWSNFAGLKQEFSDAMAEAGIASYDEITKLKIISEEHANLDNSYFSEAFDLADPSNPESGTKLFNLLANLEEMDFSEARFNTGDNQDCLPPGGDTDGSGFMSYMAKLRKVILPDGLRLVSGGAFKGCPKLVTVEIPSSVINIGAGAFRDCPSIVIDKLPESLTKIGDNAFCMTNGSSKVPGVTISELPEGVFTIGSSAFNNTNVSFSKLPEGLTHLGDKAFRNTNVTISSFPESLFESGSSLGSAAFVNCDGITEFTIPACVKSLPNQTFWPATATLERTFICYATTPPTAAIEASANQYRGVFGPTRNTTSGKDMSFITFFVPEEIFDKYEATSPYSEMNVMKIFTAKDREVSDFFQFSHDVEGEGVDHMIRSVRENVNGEYIEPVFDRERTYTLLFTPNSDVSLSYITRIEIIEQAPEIYYSVRARAGEETESGNDDDTDPNIIYDGLKSNPGKLLMPIEVDVPLKADSKVKVSMAPADGIITGVDAPAVSDNAYSYVFNLQGIRVAEGRNPDLSAMPAGIYIIRTAASVRKVVVK